MMHSIPTTRQARRAAERKLRKQARKMASSATGAALALGMGLVLAPSAQAATYSVNNLNDAGVGSLRQVITDANGNAGADTISFKAGLSGTITLTSGQLAVSDDVNIQGPGSATLTVSGNDASRVFSLDSTSNVTVTISGMTISHGYASEGAGVCNWGQDLTLQKVVLSDNVALADGGGFCMDDGTVTITDCQITGNTAQDGGGLYIGNTDGLVLIEKTVISGNSATSDGGGIFLYDTDDSVVIDRCTISGNTALDDGGGIYLYDTDGADYNGYGLLVKNTTISGNSADDKGGGVYLDEPDHPVRFENTTISGNTSQHHGGGVYFDDADGVEFAFCTIAGNTATRGGGGLYAYSGGVELWNTIVADNSDGKGASALEGDGHFDVYFSLIEGECDDIHNSQENIFDVDPQLGPLMDNGGLTLTQLPSETSPAVNSADPLFVGSPDTDQRGTGYRRIINDRADMGAVEYGARRLMVNDFDGDGNSDLPIYYSYNGTWYVRPVSTGANILFGDLWGYKGANPISGDFNGDGTSDLAVYDPKVGKWYIKSTTVPSVKQLYVSNVLAWGLQWGFQGAVAVSGDYDGDGASDPAVYNPQDGKWYIRSLAGVRTLNTGTVLAYGTQWGYKGAAPIPGDYNGDGIGDLAVYDAQTGKWHIRAMSSPSTLKAKMPLNPVLAFGKVWGFKGSTAVPGDYNGDGVADLAVYSRYDGKWYILSLDGKVLAYHRTWGFAGAIPVAGDYDGDGTSDLAVYNPADGKWYIQSMDGAVLLWGKNWGGFKGAELVMP